MFFVCPEALLGRIAPIVIVDELENAARCPLAIVTRHESAVEMWHFVPQMLVAIAIAKILTSCTSTADPK